MSNRPLVATPVYFVSPPLSYAVRVYQMTAWSGSARLVYDTGMPNAQSLPVYDVGAPGKDALPVYVANA